MDSSQNIVAIVEGPCDKDAVPELLRRILWERFERYDITVSKPRVANGRPNLIKRLEDFLEYALIEKCTAILVLLDADNDCPVELARELAQRAYTVNVHVPVAVVCANREYEAWIICSLRGDQECEIRERLEINNQLTLPENVEDLGNAKAWLTNHMPSHRAYKETSDQVVLTHYIDLRLAHDQSRSFRRLCHAVEELMEASSSRLTIVSPN